MFSTNQRAPFFVLLPIALLTLAHVIACLALLTFRARTGEYPLHSIGFSIYLSMTALSVVGLFAYFRYTEPMKLETKLLLLSLPALTSLLFQAALWMTPWLGGATYAPYDPGDSDIVAFFCLFFAVIFSIVAVLYGSIRYLLIAYLTQVLVYLGTHALPQWIRYPSADILGVRPSVFAQVLGVYALALGLLLVRNKLVQTRKLNLWLAAAIISFAGAWVLYNILTWLPTNGMQLGYVSSITIVPEHAWDWSRPAAQSIAVVSIAATIISGIGLLIQNRKVIQPHLP